MTLLLGSSITADREDDLPLLLSPSIALSPEYHTLTLQIAQYIAHRVVVTRSIDHASSFARAVRFAPEVRIRAATPVVITNQTEILPTVAIDFARAAIRLLLQRDDGCEQSEGSQSENGEGQQQGQQPLRNVQVTHAERNGPLLLRDVVLGHENIVRIDVLDHVLLNQGTRILDGQQSESLSVRGLLGRYELAPSLV